MESNINLERCIAGAWSECRDLARAFTGPQQANERIRHARDILQENFNVLLPRLFKEATPNGQKQLFSIGCGRSLNTF